MSDDQYFLASDEFFKSTCRSCGERKDSMLFPRADRCRVEVQWTDGRPAPAVSYEPYSSTGAATDICNDCHAKRCGPSGN